MRKHFINVGRVKSRSVQQPWWMHCPLCPVGSGFGMHATQADAFDAAEVHLFKAHPMIQNAEDWMLELVRRGVCFTHA